MHTTTQILELAAGRIWSAGLQVTALAVVIWLVDRLCGKASPLFRYWLWAIVFLRLLFPFDINLPDSVEHTLSTGTTAILPEIRASNTFQTLSRETGRVMTLFSGAPAGEIPLKTLDPSVDQTPKLVVNVYALIWFALATASAAVILSHLLYLRRILGKGKPVARRDIACMTKQLARDMGVRRSVGVYSVSNRDLGIPATFGILHPRIYLPSHMAATWSAGDLKPVMCHELAHVKRFDLIVNWLQIGIQIVYFFHPVVWYINRRLRDLREEICDDIAVHSLGNDRIAYSTSIFRVMETVTGKPFICMGGLGLTRRRSSIGDRIRRIMHDDYRLTLRLPAASVAALIVLGLSSLLIVNVQAQSIRPTRTDTPASGTHPAAIAGHARIALAQGALFVPHEDFKWSLAGLVDAVNRYTTIEADADAVFLGDEALMQTPFILIAADRPLSLTANESENLGNYLLSGGFAFIDNAADTPLFTETETSLRRILRDAVGNDMVIMPLSDDHEVNYCYFDFAGAPHGMNRSAETHDVREEASPDIRSNSYGIEGIWIGGRLAGILSNKGYAYRWAEFPVNSVPQVKYGVNAVVYALCQVGGMYIRDNGYPGVFHDSQSRMDGASGNKTDVVIDLTDSVREGSDRVILNGCQLMRNIDYTIDYPSGEITIFNPDASKSRADLQVRYEQDGRKSRIIDINIYDSDGNRTNGSGHDLLPMQARVSYGDGSAVYIMNTPH